MKSARYISPSIIKALYAVSGNICALPGCGQVLSDGKGRHISEIAHIYPFGLSEARYSPDIQRDELSNYEHLLVLCPTCHTKIDTPECAHIYTAEYLKEVKQQHEEKYSKMHLPEEAIDNAVSHLLLDSLGYLDPKYKIHELDKINASEQSMNKLALLKSGSYVLLSILLYGFVGILLFVLSLRHHDGDSSMFGLGRFLFMIPMFIILGAVFHVHFWRSAILIKAREGKEIMLGEWCIFKTGKQYKLYKKGFVCGFPQCGGMVIAENVKKGHFPNNRVVVRGNCKKIRSHTYIIDKDFGTYYDFTTEELIDRIENMNRYKG